MSLSGRDILGCAETGSGKTASFAIPMIQVARGRRGVGTGSGRRAVAQAEAPAASCRDQLAAPLLFVLPLPPTQFCLHQPPLRPGDGPMALVLAPTRELAQQIDKEVGRGTRGTGVWGEGIRQEAAARGWQRAFINAQRFGAR